MLLKRNCQVNVNYDKRKIAEIVGSNLPNFHFSRKT